VLLTAAKPNIYTRLTDASSLNRYDQGYFCDGTCQNAVPEVPSQEEGNQNGVPEPYLGIDLTNISPSLTKFWVTMCSGIYFL
jgi:hypothetical protein